MRQPRLLLLLLLLPLPVQQQRTYQPTRYKSFIANLFM